MARDQDGAVPHRRPGGGRAARTRAGFLGRAVAGVVAVVVVSGCAGAADTSVEGSGGRARASESPPGAVRHDRRPIQDRFPEFGDISGTSWVSDVLNDGRSGVPGPSDVRLTGVASLSAAAVAAISERYSWKTSQPPSSVPEALLSELPADGDWRTSADFDAAVTRGEYDGTFHLSAERGVVLFDAVNPVRRSS
ncbi:hypothetical protein [Streptomyces lushanensis]|uniref:hypothetical protein n=1 Tax=Streptomyces lushanensis TaxID=1434255 RepID=UPI00082A9A76|nr:hypothetical protein [Streptomyces lushanensis]